MYIILWDLTRHWKGGSLGPRTSMRGRPSLICTWWNRRDENSALPVRIHHKTVQESRQQQICWLQSKSETWVTDKWSKPRRKKILYQRWLPEESTILWLVENHPKARRRCIRVSDISRERFERTSIQRIANGEISVSSSSSHSHTQDRLDKLKPRMRQDGWLRQLWWISIENQLFQREWTRERKEGKRKRARW